MVPTIAVNDKDRSLGGAVSVAVLLLMLATESSNASGVLADRLAVSLFSAVLALSALCAGMRVLKQPGALGMPWLIIATWSAYVLTLALSYSRSSLNLATGAEAVNDGVKQAAFLLFLCILTSALRAWWLAAAAIAAPMAAISFLSAANQWIFANGATFGGFATVTDYLGVGVLTARHAGPMPDPNFWGRLMVVGLAFALALASDARLRRRSVGLFAASCLIVLLLTGIYLTGSRGTFLAAAVGVFAYLLLAGMHLRLVAGIAVLVAVALPLLPGIGGRLFTVIGLAQETQRAAVDESVLERLGAQRVAVAMFRDHPLTGVGPDGFLEAFPEYAARTDLSFSRVVASHNLYLGLAAEGGLVGVVTWLVFIGVAFFLGIRTLRNLTWLPQGVARTVRPYVAACLAALAAWCAASAFLHLAYVRILLIVVAMIGILDWQVRRQLRGIDMSPPVPRRATESLSGRSPERVMVMGALVGALVCAALVLASPGRPRAQAVGVLQPELADPYHLDLRSRPSIVPTFALMVAVTSTGVEAQGDPNSGRINVTAEGLNSATRVREAIVLATDRIQRTGLGRLYRVSWSEVVVRPPAVSSGLLALAAAGGAIAGGGAPYLYWLSSRGRRYKPRGE